MPNSTSTGVHQKMLLLPFLYGLKGYIKGKLLESNPIDSNEILPFLYGHKGYIKGKLLESNGIATNEIRKEHS